jgi:hypothetical protein
VAIIAHAIRRSVHMTTLFRLPKKLTQTSISAPAPSASTCGPSSVMTVPASSGRPTRPEPVVRRKPCGTGTACHRRLTIQASRPPNPPQWVGRAQGTRRARRAGAAGCCLRCLRSAPQMVTVHTAGASPAA